MYQSERYKNYVCKTESVLVVYDSHLKVWTICMYDSWYITTRKHAQKVIRAINLINNIVKTCDEWR